MRGWMDRQAKLLLGLDITESTVKVLDLGKQGDFYRVNAYGMAERQSQESLSDTIARLLNETGIKKKTCAIALPDQLVFRRTLVFKAGFKEEDILSEIELSAEQYLPYPLEALYYDFQILPPQKKNVSQIDVLLVAAKIDVVDEKIAVIEEAGLEVKLVDIESDALVRAGDLGQKCGGNPLMHMQMASTIAYENLHQDAEKLMLSCGLAIRYLYDQA